MSAHRPRRPPWRVIVLVTAVILSAAVLTTLVCTFWLLGPGQQAWPPPQWGPQLRAWAAIMLAIVFQALPFLVLGTLISAAISTFLPPALLARITPRSRFLAVPALATCGLALPGCECAAVPVSDSLQRRGLPAPAALAFMLASPAINPVVLAATAVAFTGRPAFVWARLAASLLAAIVVGWLWIALAPARARRSESPVQAPVPQPAAHLDGPSAPGSASPAPTLPPAPQSAPGSACPSTPGSVRPIVGRLPQLVDFAAHLRSDFLNAGGYLVLGAVVAAGLKVCVPARWLQAFGEHLWAGALLMAVLAVVLSLCSEADAFVAASLTGVHPVALLVFLVVGPMVDLKLIAMQYGTWGGRFVARFVPLTLLCATASAVTIGLLLL